jgi:hypothetical protein
MQGHPYPFSDGPPPDPDPGAPPFCFTAVYDADNRCLFGGSRS